VCVGEDVQPDDYPTGLFSAQELEVLRQKTSGAPYDSDYDDEVAETDVPFTTYYFTFPSVSGMEEDVCLCNKSLALMGPFCMPHISRDPAYYFIRKEIRVDEKTYYP
jgi:hypothetical protein